MGQSSETWKTSKRLAGRSPSNPLEGRAKIKKGLWQTLPTSEVDQRPQGKNATAQHQACFGIVIVPPPLASEYFPWTRRWSRQFGDFERCAHSCGRRLVQTLRVYGDRAQRYASQGSNTLRFPAFYLGGDQLAALRVIHGDSVIETEPLS